MMRAIIIDDQEKARQLLTGLLSQFIEEVEPVGDAGTIREAVSLIKNLNPDLVFLDVELEGEMGFELFDQIAEVDFEVIFTTAHSKYAIQAIQFSAIDYLLKPIGINQLQSAVERVKEKKEKEKVPIQVLLDNLKGGDRKPQRLVLPGTDSFTVVQVEEIIRCDAENNYCRFFLTDGSQILVSKPLKEYDQLLSGSGFMRIHQSHLINLRHVRKFARGKARFVIMTDQQKVEISRSNQEEFLRRFAEIGW